MDDTSWKIQNIHRFKMDGLVPPKHSLKIHSPLLEVSIILRHYQRVNNKLGEINFYIFKYKVSLWAKPPVVWVFNKGIVPFTHLYIVNRLFAPSKSYCLLWVNDIMDGYKLTALWSLWSDLSSLGQVRDIFTFIPLLTIFEGGYGTWLIKTMDDISHYSSQ